MSTGNLEVEYLHLHNVSCESLNIQLKTFRTRSKDNWENPMNNNKQMTKTHFVPKIMATNVMSRVPKIVEVIEFILRNDIDLETWLKEQALMELWPFLANLLYARSGALSSMVGYASILRITSGNTSL